VYCLLLTCDAFQVSVIHSKATNNKKLTLIIFNFGFSSWAYFFIKSYRKIYGLFSDSGLCFRYAYL